MCVIPSTLLHGCVPYAVGTTAATVAPRALKTTAMLSPSTQTVSLRNEIAPVISDFELRTGINDRSDAGLRITDYSGVMLSYKVRVFGEVGEPGLAAQAEAGVLDDGKARVAGATLIASGNEASFLTPFGGGRWLVIGNHKSNIVPRAPVVGLFAGVRIGNRDTFVAPELGVFRDRLRQRMGSAPGWLVVPSLSVSLNAFMKLVEAIAPPSGRAPTTRATDASTTRRD